MARAKKDTAAEDDAKASLLLRKAEDGYAFPALAGVANQFARSLRDLISAPGAPTVQVARGAADRVRLAAWCREAALAIFWPYHRPPLQGTQLIAGARPVLLHPVNILYGRQGRYK